jgi:hypothetical protein
VRTRSQQQEVDDVAGPGVGRGRRIMRIGACVELLCDLEPQCQRREGFRLARGSKGDGLPPVDNSSRCSSRKERKHVRLDRIGTH